MGGRYQVQGCGAGVADAEHVYFAKAGYDQSSNPPAPRLLRLHVATGVVIPATPQVYARDLRADPRALMVGDSWRTGARETEGDFAVVGSLLVPAAFDSASNHWVPTRAHAFDADTGQPVQLRLPAGYRPGPPPSVPLDGPAGSVRHFGLFEWLDDDTVALAQVGDNNHMGDIITCRLSEGACHVVVEAPPSPDQARLVVGQSLP